MTKKYYAHSLEGEPPEKWQGLEEHLKIAPRTGAWIEILIGRILTLKLYVAWDLKRTMFIVYFGQ
jgi:hypothetical protein